MKKLALIVACGLCFTQPAGAADSGSAPAKPLPAPLGHPAWALQVTPYIWAAGLDGTMSPFRRAPTIHVEKPFSEILDDLNFGGFANVWARYDRFVFSGDVMYIDITEGRGTGPLPALQIPELDVTIPAGARVDAKVDTAQFMATLQGGYLFIDTPHFTLDVLAGARVWYISNDVTVTASDPAIGTLSATHGESFGWVDPLVGLRAFLPLTDTLSVQAQADIGGFGVGSHRTWSALATVNYTVTDHISVSAGYKALNVDYSGGGHSYDTRLRGPVLGATWRF